MDSLAFPFPNPQNQTAGSKVNSPLYLKDPANVQYDIEYDPIQQKYVIKEKLGDLEYRSPDEKSFDDFWKDRNAAAEKDYWKEKQQESTSAGNNKGVFGGGDINLPSKGIDKIFGPGGIQIKPQGSAELIFGVMSSKTENPVVRVDNQRTTNFEFDQKIQLNVTGKIGEKLKLSTSYNTEASFDFENQMKLEYNGNEDDIIKKIELGNVSLPLNSSLIQGSQSLFGIKNELQFGKLKVTSVLTQQKSESKTIELSGGVQTKEVYIKADDYDDNRHFFLSQYFTNNYNSAVASPPLINSPVIITKIEVWITNVGISANAEARNVIGFMDLGETTTYDPTLIPNLIDPYPDNTSNDLYGKMNADVDVRKYTSASGQLINTYKYSAGTNFNKIENARKLRDSEYIIHPQLGYISLNRRMEDDEVLAVAYQYTVRGSTKIYQVGEFSNEISDVISSVYLKMLKSTQVNNTKVPLWNLMMKNVYSLGQYGIDANTLEIDIRYKDAATNNDINFMSAGNPNVKNKRWLNILGLDKLDQQQNKQPDGRYDIIDNLTIRLSNGKIYFPVLEPFGKALRTQINDQTLSDSIAFDSLYAVSKFRAKNEFPSNNRFRIYAKYSSKSSVINLNSFSIPKGAVTVTAGGQKLVEGQHFRVDYTMGQVSILDPSILNSNIPIKVNVESNSMFSVTSKTIFGSHLEYEINKDFHVGGTILNLTERPLTQKVNQGEEPISNTIWGVNSDYKKESQYLTKLIDLIPGINTKAKSSISLKGEFAQLIPGSPSAIKNGDNAVSFIDAFESGQTGIDIRNRAAWVLASTPQGQASEWPEGDLVDDITYGFNRAKFAWYNIDPLFSVDNSSTPAHIRNNKSIQENLYQRTVLQSEIYPQKSLAVGEPPTLQTFDLAYFPSERGPYNYDTSGVGGVSAGVNTLDGSLIDPDTRWGGIMRKIDYVDFASQNIEFIEFWLMDPFPTDPTSASDIDAFNGSYEGGDFYLQIGNISEDVLRDGRKSFENGLPKSGSAASTIDSTSWGRVSNSINLVNAFDNDPQARADQDVGFDGLGDDNERTFFKNYLDWYTAQGLPHPRDPSGDNYQYFRGANLDANLSNVIDRYKNYNGTDGNSPTQDQTGLDYVSTATTLPDIEDLNRDNTLSEGESYYEYKISLRQSDLGQANIGRNYLVQKVPVTVAGSGKIVNWYNFRIPVKIPDRTVGNIQDFQSIRFMRLILKGWKDPVVLRFGSLDLIRSDWRKYEGDLYASNTSGALTSASFNVGAVNLEEDSKKSPIPYMMPPNTQRQFNLGSQAQENEQAMQLEVCDLDGTDARAMYKTVGLDLLSYKKIQMDIHAEQANNSSTQLANMNMSVFIRMGNDFDENYYEYEVPLTFTDQTSLPAGEVEKREAIWDANNKMDFNYEDVFAGVKSTRNSAILNGANGVSNVERYKSTDGKNNVYVIGSPSMANVTTIMIGVRNNNPVGDLRCAEVWVNELRLSEFDKTGGWATTASINMKLADFGNLSFGGGYSTPGWGGINQKVSERQRETIRNIDATGNFELGKFIPEKIGITVPMYMSYNQVRKDKQYNPLDTDIQLNKLEKGAYKTLLNKISPELQTSKSINFSNVKKLAKGRKKKHIYDVENLDATFAYSENKQQDVNTEYSNVMNYKGALNYNFKTKLKAVEPFKRTPIIKIIERKRLADYAEEEKGIRAQIKKTRQVKGSSKKIPILQKKLKVLREEKVAYKKRISKIKRSPYLKLYRDFNFFYMPSQLSFKTDMSRMFSENKIRNVSDANLLIEPTFNKNWYFNRNYKVKFDLTKALKLDYSAQNNALIDEPFGEINTKTEKDSILNNILKLGRNTIYTQNVNANYRVPINKFPWTSWVTANLKYTGKFDWQATNPSLVDSIGHSISNSNSKQINTQLNFVSLYNKVDYLKKLNRKKRRRSKSAKKPNEKPDSLKTKKIVKNKLLTGKDILDGSLRVLMMLRSASINYTENNGTFLPGFMGETQVGGMDLNNSMAPGLGFVFGDQTDILEKGLANKWFNSNDYLITQQVAKTQKRTLNGRASIEPFKRFKVNLNATRNETMNDNFYYEIDTNFKKGFREGARQNIKTLSITINTTKTSFSKKRKDGSSAAYHNMLSNRLVIAQRLASNNPKSVGTNINTSYPEGYSKSHEEVLLYSFLAAYQGKNAANISLPNLNTANSTKGLFPKIPIPNWRLNFNALNTLPFIKKHFKSFTLSHSYSSTLNMNGVKNDINFGSPDPFDAEGDLLTNIDYTTMDVSIKESYSPLIKVDMKFKNSVLAKFEVKKSRTIGLDFGGQAVTENSSWDIVVGAGYSIKDLVIPNVKIKGKKIKSNLNLRADVSVKNSRLILIKIDETPTPTSGGLVTAIKISGDYVISKKVTARIFYDQTINTPFIQTSYPSSTSRGGLSIRFTL